MKRKEFIKIVTDAMKEVQKYNNFTCNALDKKFYNKKDWECFPDSEIRKDYISVFGIKQCNGSKYWIPINFSCLKYSEMKQVRLNALAMYFAQSLAFKTYKEL